MSKPRSRTQTVRPFPPTFPLGYFRLAAGRLSLPMMLLLKKHLVALVRAGKKRQTIRLWNRPHVRVGQISYTPGLGKLKITGVDELPNLEALTEADAIADGFATLPELLREIHNSYPVIPAGKRIFRVSFQWPVETVESAPRPAAVNGPVATIFPQPKRPKILSIRAGPPPTPTITLNAIADSAKPLQRRPSSALNLATGPQREALKTWVTQQMRNQKA